MKTTRMTRSCSAAVVVAIAPIVSMAACTGDSRSTATDSAGVADTSPMVDSAAPGSGVADTALLPTPPAYPADPNVTRERMPAPLTPPDARTMPPVAGETSKPGGTMGPRLPPPDDRRERDSAVQPAYEVGPDGKVRPVRR
ncbi:MAG: hypothetical protein H0T48_08560 [Gemmatimonadaceae bacterium]|nr:hypothetical protein [Gemmatimonadaceae bacterium]